MTMQERARAKREQANALAEQYAEEARTGDGECIIGKKYLYGENGFPIDKPMARSYLEKASEKGNQEAKNLIKSEFSKRKSKRRKRRNGSRKK